MATDLSGFARQSAQAMYARERTPSNGDMPSNIP
uniref:Uncharacterized protein n=1 Tax=Ascaris lumbricoides TaxID=6252 RepID=A0A9J2PZA6_ASCLU